jgi:hypothetical protein
MMNDFTDLLLWTNYGGTLADQFHDHRAWRQI